MLTWLLLGTAVYLLTLYVPSVFLISRIGLVGYFGARDAEPEKGIVHARAKRAASNEIENFPVFMGLGILALVVDGADIQIATTGAMIYVLGRVAFTLIYILGIPFLRSAVFMAAWIGMLLMGYALI